MGRYLNRQLSSKLNVKLGYKYSARSNGGDFSEAPVFLTLLDYIGEAYKNDTRILDLIEQGVLNISNSNEWTLVYEKDQSSGYNIVAGIEVVEVISTLTGDSLNCIIAIYNNTVVFFGVIGKDFEPYCAYSEKLDMDNTRGNDFTAMLQVGDRVSNEVVAKKRRGDQQITIMHDDMSILAPMTETWIFLDTKSNATFMLTATGRIFEVDSAKGPYFIIRRTNVPRAEFIEALRSGTTYKENLNTANVLYNKLNKKVIDSLGNKLDYIPITDKKTVTGKSYQKIIEYLDSVGHQLDQDWVNKLLKKSLVADTTMDLEDGYQVRIYKTEQIVKHGKKDLTRGGKKVNVYHMYHNNVPMKAWSLDDKFVFNSSNDLASRDYNVTYFLSKDDSMAYNVFLNSKRTDRQRDYEIIASKAVYDADVFFADIEAAKDLDKKMDYREMFVSRFKHHSNKYLAYNKYGELGTAIIPITENDSGYKELLERLKSNYCSLLPQLSDYNAVNIEYGASEAEIDDKLMYASRFDIKEAKFNGTIPILTSMYQNCIDTPEEFKKALEEVGVKFYDRQGSKIVPFSSDDHKHHKYMNSSDPRKRAEDYGYTLRVPGYQHTKINNGAFSVMSAAELESKGSIYDGSGYGIKIENIETEAIYSCLANFVITGCEVNVGNGIMMPVRVPIRFDLKQCVTSNVQMYSNIDTRTLDRDKLANEVEQTYDDANLVKGGDFALRVEFNRKSHFKICNMRMNMNAESIWYSVIINKTANIGWNNEVRDALNKSMDILTNIMSNGTGYSPSAKFAAGMYVMNMRHIVYGAIIKYGGRDYVIEEFNKIAATVTMGSLFFIRFGEKSFSYYPLSDRCTALVIPNVAQRMTKWSSGSVGLSGTGSKTLAFIKMLIGLGEQRKSIYKTFIDLMYNLKTEKSENIGQERAAITTLLDCIAIPEELALDTAIDCKVNEQFIDSLNAAFDANEDEMLDDDFYDDIDGNEDASDNVGEDIDLDVDDTEDGELDAEADLPDELDPADFEEEEGLTDEQLMDDSLGFIVDNGNVVTWVMVMQLVCKKNPGMADYANDFETLKMLWEDQYNVAKEQGKVQQYLAALWNGNK